MSNQGKEEIKNMNLAGDLGLLRLDLQPIRIKKQVMESWVGKDKEDSRPEQAKTVLIVNRAVPERLGQVSGC